MMKFTTRLMTLIMLLALSIQGFSQNWQMVWQDEFTNGYSSDWVFETGAGGWGNNELEYYRQENASVQNGHLVLTAKQESFGGANYTSVRMKTQGKKSWTYGKIEASIAVPSFNGAWPAFWMLGDNIGSVGWPTCGEMDIMEHVNTGNADYGTIHWNLNGHQSYSNNTNVNNITTFHTYTLIWNDQSISWLVDGVQYAQANIANNINGTDAFHKSFFILLNFAIGGQWPGYNIDNGALPSQMLVDYVRVYQDNGVPPIAASTGLITTYQDCNYSGFSGGLSLGDYNLARLQSLGIQDNSISSLHITEGYQAILFQDDNFGGASTVINSDNTCLNTTWNDQVSSVRIIPNGVTNLAGTYYVKNRNSGLTMDVWGAGTADGTNIAQGVLNGGTNQQFKFTHLGNGLYQILAVHSGKSVDVSAISTADGANVQEWTYYGTPNQQFIVTPTGDGYYKLIPSHSGKVVEVAGASTANGGNIQQWTNNNQTCGQWGLVTPPSPSTGIITTYQDCNYSGFSGGFSLGDYNLARLQSLGIQDNSISSLHITEGYQAILFQDDNFGGASTVINSDNTCLNTTWNDQVSSVRIIPNGVTNVAGTYYVKNRNSGLTMDVWGAATADGTNIAQGVLNGGTNQQFKFTHLGNGLYQILAVHSGKSVDVSAISTADGANVQEWTYYGTPNQQFIVTPTGDGYYKLIPSHSGKVVEVAGASTANGGNIQQWTNNNQTCGQWGFVPVVVAPPVNGNGDGLTGNYFNGMNFDTPVYSRVDANINFDWGNGSPNAAVNADAFSARWSGQIQPRYSETYTFYANTDNGRRVWINGQLVIDKWIDDWGTEYTGTITLTANQKYDIKVEYFEDYGGANAKLEWSSASQVREVLPTSQLYSNPLPTVSISSPANNATFTSPAAITITSSASDNGSVAKVEYYNGATKLGESASSPYSFTWSNVAAGSYTLTARATDNQGGITASGTVTVKVNQGTTPNQAPSVSLTSPANGSSSNAPASITISANASDADGTVSKVDFYNGTTLLFSDATSPYSYTWTSVGAGTYTISAKATDNLGAATTSASVTVTVKAVVTDACSGLPTYAENNGYVAGSKVKNVGRQYECKEFPYSGWCNGAAWAYGPGTGSYWTDAWYDRGACSARTGNDAADASTTESATVYPNPATDQITIQLSAAAQVSVYNSQGTLVIASRTFESTETINISELAAGMYLVKIETGSDVMTRQVVKR